MILNRFGEDFYPLVYFGANLSNLLWGLESEFAFRKLDYDAPSTASLKSAMFLAMVAFELKIHDPTTSTSAPAETTSTALSGLMPPSTSIVT